MNNFPTEKILSIENAVLAAQNIVLLGHIRPAGDAHGSNVAMLWWLRSLGKPSKIILPHLYPDSVSFLVDEKIAQDVIIHEAEPQMAVQTLSKADLIIILDLNEYSRTGDMAPILEASEADKILIDHHLYPQTQYFKLCFSYPEASSTCELLYYILKAMPGVGAAENLPLECLKALMTGMTTDTNNFANSVIPTTLQMASECIAAGVDRDEILGYIYNSYRPNRVALQGFLLHKQLKITEDGVAYMILSNQAKRAYDVQEGDGEGFVNIPLAIKDVRMSIFLKEDKGKFRVSIRSKKGTSANKLAKQYFNGGGHELASGGSLYVPSQVKTCADVAAYVERVTHEFFANE